MQLGRRAVKLSNIRRLGGGKKAEVELSDGIRLPGQFKDLQHLAVMLGGTPNPLDLTNANEVIFTASFVETKTPVFDATIRDTVP
jgi:hypothetical protein